MTKASRCYMLHTRANTDGFEDGAALERRPSPLTLSAKSLSRYAVKSGSEHIEFLLSCRRVRAGKYLVQRVAAGFD